MPTPDPSHTASNPIMLLSARLSRWSMAYFACAITNFILATLLMASGCTYPAIPVGSPLNLIAVHLITVGWLTLLMFGALSQFVPVITNKPLPSQSLMLAGLCLLETGLLGMIAGFWALNGTLPLSLRILLPCGGALVVLGVLADIAVISIPLLRTRPFTLPGKLVITALGYLIVTVSLGLCFALGLGVNHVASPLMVLLGEGLSLHIVAGLGGWFLLTAIGVGYKLLPMFMLAPEERGHLGESLFMLIAGGIFLYWIAHFISLWYPEHSLKIVWITGMGMAVFGTALYFMDIVKLYRTRQRKSLELNSRAAAGALFMMALAIVLTVTALMFSKKALPAGLFLLLIGYLSGLGLSQLYKIVPFLTWLELFGSKLGQGPVPRVQDLVLETRAAPWFIFYFIAVTGSAVAMLLNLSFIFQLTASAQLVALLAITLELWRARHPGNSSPERVSATPFILHKEETKHGSR